MRGQAWLGSVALALTATFSGGAGHAAAEDMFQPLSPERADLRAYRWQKRVLLIFSPSEHDPDFRATLSALRSRSSALADRHLLVLTDTVPEAEGRLRGRFGASGFRIIRVGKDGGVKLDRASRVPPDDLFALIDAMPMRRQEIRDR